MMKMVTKEINKGRKIESGETCLLDCRIDYGNMSNRMRIGNHV